MARNKTKSHDEIFGEMVAGLGEAISFAQGDGAGFRVHVPETIDVKAVRTKTGLSQEKFANTFGVPPATIRDWEQNRRAPDQAARMYLKAIETDASGMVRILKRIRSIDDNEVAMGGLKRRSTPARVAARASAHPHRTR